MEKVRVGIFGLSRGLNYFDPIRVQPNAELVAVCDNREKALEAAKNDAEKKGFSVEVFNNFDDFINYDMDAVILCNYADDHARFAIMAMEAGKHVMCEVLPATSCAEAIELIEAVERTGKFYFYAENYCYMKVPFEMWRRYKLGDIGEVQYAEGEYIHPAGKISESNALTNNQDPKHWRMRMHPNFYCTHSVGPLLTITGLRPKSVVGFNTNPGLRGKSVGIEMVTLENGAILRSVHGAFRHHSITYQINGTFGTFEANRKSEIGVTLHPDPEVEGSVDYYVPDFPVENERGQQIETHHGSDYYPTHFFVEKILGNKAADEWLIDVYLGVDMMLCGLMAQRSVINGNVSVEIPDFRLKEARDKYRNDFETHMKPMPYKEEDR